MAAYPVMGPIDVLDEEVGAMDEDLTQGRCEGAHARPRRLRRLWPAIHLAPQRARISLQPPCAERRRGRPGRLTGHIPAHFRFDFFVARTRSGVPLLSRVEKESGIPAQGRMTICFANGPPASQPASNAAAPGHCPQPLPSARVCTKSPVGRGRSVRGGPYYFCVVSTDRRLSWPSHSCPTPPPAGWSTTRP